MIHVHDIIKINMTDARVQHLCAGGDQSKHLADHNGDVMQVSGIQHTQMPEELRTFVLEDFMYPGPPYVYATRADLEFIRHGEPRSRATVDPEPPSPEPGPREQLNLFMEAE